jgi:hypothetical protein
MLMSYTLMVILSYSILPAAVAAIFRFKYVAKEYYPIMLCIGIGLGNEVISTVLISHSYSNAMNSNLYSLAEALLILVQFRRWGLFFQHHSGFYAIGLCFCVFWGIENRSLHYFNSFLPYFKSFLSVCIVIMAIIEINKLIISYPGTLFKAPGFLICTGFCLFFTTSMLLEIFLFYGLTNTCVFRDMLFKSACIVNVVTNFLYLIAILWMPPKPRYIMP